MGYVLEGPDGAGKTTLARELAQRYQMRWNHFGPPKKPPLEEYLHWLVGLDPDHHRVIDRFHLGESVYGPIWRGTLPLTPPILMTIEWALMVRGYTLVHVTQSLRALVNAIEERGDELVKVEELGKIIEGYWSVMHLSFMDRIVYDWRQGEFNPDERTRAEERAQLSREYCQWVKGYPGTGSLSPQHIFVGERINPNLAEKSRGVPFACGTAGDWLLHAIWQNGWQSSCYLTNAKKLNGSEDQVAREIRWLRGIRRSKGLFQPTIYALGKTAKRVLDSHQLESILIAHPSYHRRFHHGDGPVSYAQLLRTS